MKRKLIKAFDLICFFLYNRIAALFSKLDDHKALFLSEAHLSLDGNLKAVYDGMPEGYEKKAYIKSDRRDNYTTCEKLRLWKDMTTAKYIFLDDFYGLTSSMKVRNGQELIQLWHGAGAFKKFGFSRLNTGDSVKNINGGYRKYTKAAVTSEAARSCFAEAFDIDMEKVQAVGSPRTDIFFDQKTLEEARVRVYEKYPELRGKKVVLIAPTYRGSKVEDAHYDFEKLNLGRISADLGNDYKVVAKWHPALYSNIKRGLCGDYNPEGIIDASDYKDINDLLTVTDVLVTDYSSVIFDYFLLDKPVIYFIYDRENYEMGRGIYFPFDEYVYGLMATDYQGLIEAIRAEDKCSERRESFGEKFMSACDGKSTQRVIDWSINGQYNRQK